MTGPASSERTTRGGGENVPPGGALLGSIGAAIARTCMVVSGIMLIAIVVINAVNVFNRYVLFSALSWAEEAMVFLMIGSVFLGAIAVTWEQAHIRIDALIHAFTGGKRVAVEVLSLVVAIAVLIPVGIVSLEVVGLLKSFDQRSEALHFPVWIPQATLPMALLAIPVLMVVALVRNRGRGSTPHGGLDPQPTLGRSGRDDRNSRS